MSEEKEPKKSIEIPRLPNAVELSESDLDKVVGGTEAPKETVSFEYGALQVKYVQQKPDGSS
jgi:hypothetical protein